MNMWLLEESYSPFRTMVADIKKIVLSQASSNFYNWSLR